MASIRILFLFVLALAQWSLAKVDYSEYVNPFIGGSGPFPGLAFGGGDIFIGGARPFGVVKVGIDTYETNTSFSTINGGWTPEGLVTGVSMMHESGTGGPAKYGIISQMPLTTIESPVNLLDNRTYWQRRTVNDTASVGYYATQLESGVKLQLSAARHSAVFEYEFSTAEKHVLVDVSHFLSDETGSNEDQFYAGGSIHLHEDGKTYTGYGSFGGGFSDSAPMVTYFCGEFEEAPDEAKTFRGANTFPTARQHGLWNAPIPSPRFGNRSEESGPMNERVGAVFTWTNASTSTVRSRVGISMISAAKACDFTKAEITSWDLQQTVADAVQEWNDDVFSKIQVSTKPTQNQTNLVLLYSSLYFMHLMPSDRSGENPLWESTDSFDDIYTLWDVFRCTVSLWHLIQPKMYQSFVRSLVDIWEHEGYMPDGRSGNWNGLTQGGSNADNVLADAYVKNLANVNWTAAYLAMKKDAEVQPDNTFNLVDSSNGIQQGRGALNDWLNYGYVSSDKSTRAVSRTIEYSLNDFSLAQVAKGEAPGDVSKYLNRSANWQNIWAHNLTHKNFTGFPAPRLSTGEFDLDDYNPALCGSGCEWTSIAYEATPFEYAFTVPHDMETLIAFMGGPDAFESRLDYIMQPGTSEQNLGANGAGITSIMNIGNEPDFATPYEYHYLNKQAKSVQQSRSLANQYFHNATYGVPGNSDAGALNSWLIWQMLGLYPVVTQPLYLLVSPWFESIKVSVNGNRTLLITAHNLDNEDSYYVQAVAINGRNVTQNWVTHDDLMVNGGTVEFYLGPEMTYWDTGSVPPSPGHVSSPEQLVQGAAWP